jgi:uncharacterized DUF497 family protein
MNNEADSIYEFEWDDSKAAINLAKHKVSFSEGKTVFKDPFLVTFPDDLHSDVENRLISIGMSEKRRLLLIVHVEKLEAVNFILIRIISCRKATPSERKMYEENR